MKAALANSIFHTPVVLMPIFLAAVPDILLRASAVLRCQTNAAWKVPCSEN
jgi:hypothetical protein